MADRKSLPSEWRTRMANRAARSPSPFAARYSPSSGRIHAEQPAPPGGGGSREQDAQLAQPLQLAAQSRLNGAGAHPHLGRDHVVRHLLEDDGLKVWGPADDERVDRKLGQL
jgi:hypothetical protein